MQNALINAATTTAYLNGHGLSHQAQQSMHHDLEQAHQQSRGLEV
ncbi:hypothetical protein [Nostoc sp.]